MIALDIVVHFVAHFARRVGDYLVVITAIDWGEAYEADERPTPKPFGEMSDAEKWEFFKAAANAEDAIEVLKSARILD